MTASDEIFDMAVRLLAGCLLLACGSGAANRGPSSDGAPGDGPILGAGTGGSVGTSDAGAFGRDVEGDSTVITEAGEVSGPGGGGRSGGSSGRGGAGGRLGTGGAASGTGGRGIDAGIGLGGAPGSGGGPGFDGGTGSGGSSCTTPPVPSALVGWAAESGNEVPRTTGGGDASPTTVSSLAALRAAVAGDTPAVVYVKGVLAAGSISVGSNKTIVGLCGAEIHGHVEMSGSINVIVRNLTIVGYAVGDCALDPSFDASKGCSSGQDAISVQKNAHHIWFDHCDISDGTDGNLDITNAANYVTVSWTKFHYTPRVDTGGTDSTGASGHRFSNLVGGTDNPTTYDDAHALNVTWHHNWWASGVMERMPRVRFGKNHIFNNLYTASGDNYCVRAGTYAQILLENNVFAAVRSPHEFDGAADEATASITAKNNLYAASTGRQDTGGGGTPFSTVSYSYALDPTAGLQAAIQAGAGPQ